MLRKLVIFLIIGTMLLLAGCSADLSPLIITKTPSNLETVEMNKVTIQTIHFESLLSSW